MKKPEGRFEIEALTFERRGSVSFGRVGRKGAVIWGDGMGKVTGARFYLERMVLAERRTEDCADHFAVALAERRMC